MALTNHGRHGLFSFLSSLPISVLRNLELEANKLYDRANKLYKAALLTRCYVQHFLCPYIDSEVNHKRHFIKIPFINKGIEFIDLHSIFKDNSVISSIPNYFNNSETPIICYKYNKPIRSTIFNFNKIVNDLDIDSNTPASWDCKNSNYLYPSAGHVITGNLNVIPDARVRNIISKGPKYRFASNIDFSKCRREIAASLNDFSNRWCKRENVEPDALKEWKINIFKIIDTRISFYSRNTHLLPTKPKSSFRHLKRGIQDFHMNYVLVPADKAANNIVVVWRLYYINTLKRELVDTDAYKLQPSLSERVIVDGHGCHTALHFGVKAKENQDKVPTLYWLPKLHKKPYKARFIANSSSCTTTELSKLLTSCLTAVKKHVIKYCEKVYERSGKNLFWSIKNSGEILDKLKARDFNATSLSTYDFSTLYTTLPHNLIKDKLIDLIENTFQREGSPYLACSDRNAFFTSEKPKKYHAWSCQNVCDALTFLLDNIFIRFGTKLYRQVVGIPMGTNYAPLVADLFLFCYERDFMMSLSDDKQADVIDAFNTTSRYLDNILNINNVYFDNMVSQIYPSELQLNKANASDTEAAFLDLHLSISNDIVSTKIYDKRDDFDFEIVNFPFLDGDVPRSTSYGVYISQLIRFARASSYVADFNTRNKLLTQKLLKQGYRYHKLRKTFSKFYRRYYDLISKFQVGLKSLLRQGLSEPDFYGDLVYKLKKIVGSNNFSAQFIKIISHYKKIGYNINVLQQTACLVVNPITVGNFAFLFNCTPVGRTSDSMMVPT